MRTTFACASFLGLALLAGGASAQSAEPELDASFNVALTSDYMYRGFSQTDRGPALQVGVDLAAGGYYVGAWASTVDFGDGTDAEFNLYGGYTTSAGGYDLDFGLLGVAYAGAPDRADYNFIEAQASVSRTIDNITVGVAVAYSPDFYGVDDHSTYLEANLEVAAHPRLTLSGAVGHQWLDVSGDYVTWNVGATYALTDFLSADLRYHDTDVRSPLSDGRFALTLGAAF